MGEIVENLPIDGWFFLAENTNERWWFGYGVSVCKPICLASVGEVFLVEVYFGSSYMIGIIT